MTHYIRQVNGLIGLINIISFLKLFNWEDEKIMLIFTLLSYILHFSHGPFLIKYWLWCLLFFKAQQLDCSSLPVSGVFLSLFPFSPHFFFHKHSVRSIEFLPERPLWMFLSDGQATCRAWIPQTLPEQWNRSHSSVPQLNPPLLN